MLVLIFLLHIKVFDSFSSSTIVFVRSVYLLSHRNGDQEFIIRADLYTGIGWEFMIVLERMYNKYASEAICESFYSTMENQKNERRTSSSDTGRPIALFMVLHLLISHYPVQQQ